MSLKRYHLTGSTKFFNDAKTYYNVPYFKVPAGVRYMCEEFKLDRIFIYLSSDNFKIGSNPYICCYNYKYDNYRTSDGFLHTSFPA